MSLLTRRRYVSYTITRVLEVVPCSKFFAFEGTDAERIGRFNDSVSDVVCVERPLAQFSEELIAHAKATGFCEVTWREISLFEYKCEKTRFARVDEAFE